MTTRLRKTLLTSAAFLMTTGVASANLLTEDDPFAGERALTPTELSEARGGFSAGGFNFNFGVTFSPVFGDGGVFGDNGSPIPDEGLFGDDGLFGSDGVFGEGGVFGDTGAPGNSSSNTSTTLTDVSLSTETTTTTTTSQSQPAPTGGGTGAPTTSASPSSATTSGGGNSSGAGGTQTLASGQGGGAPSAPTVDVNAPDAPSSAQGSAHQPQPANAGQSAALPTNEAAGGQGDSKVVVDTVPTGTNLVPQQSSPQDAASMQQNYAGMNVSEVIKQQLTFVYNNTKDGAKLQQDVDFNIDISNYDQNIARMGIASSVARAIPDRSIFNNLF